MTTNLAALGEEYLKTAEAVNKRIAELKPLLKSAPPAKLPLIERRIMLLYREHAELRKSGYMLKNYYNKENAYAKRSSLRRLFYN